MHTGKKFTPLKIIGIINFFTIAKTILLRRFIVSKVEGDDARWEWAKKEGGSSDRCVSRRDRKNCLRKYCAWVDWNALKTGGAYRNTRKTVGDRPADGFNFGPGLTESASLGVFTHTCI